MKILTTFAFTSVILLTSINLMATEKPSKQAANIANIDNGKTKAETVCVACHGADGNSTNALWPKLAGQHTNYITKQLNDFVSGKRSDPLMSSQAKALSKQDIIDVAAFFNQQTIKQSVADVTQAEAGKAIYKGGKLKEGITACSSCHSPNGMGNPAANYPRIAGQHVDYLMKTLKDFRSGARTNSHAGIMEGIAKRMSDKDISAVSEYISGLRK